MTARIPPGNWRDVGVVNWLIAVVSGKVIGAPPPHLFLTLGRHRRLFRGWLRFAGRLMPGGTLSRRETELVILRVALLRDCEYEYAHHVRLGRRAGLSDAEIHRLTEGPGNGWSDRERAVLSAVDQLCRTRDLDDESWTALRGHLNKTECIELCLLVGHYDMLATVIKALRIEPDPRATAIREQS
ncbi:MAG: carboxymuconolactone decarboxylase family protein [Micromonosporaceae bacterium]